MTYNASGFFALRTPLLAYETLAELSEGLVACDAHADRRAAAIAADKSRVAERMAKLVQESAIAEALFIASPPLHAAVERWLDDPTTPEAAATTASLYRYLVRMASRSTPFGLFSGLSVGSVVARADTNLAMTGRGQYRRHSRLDMGYIAKLSEALQRDAAIRSALTYRLGSSVYRAGGKVRMLELRDDGASNVRSYSLVSFEPNVHLDVVLDMASVGVRRAELVRGLRSRDVELSDAGAIAFVDSVIDARLIEPDMGAAITGGDPLESLVARLRELGAPVSSVLSDVRDRLVALDTRFGNPTSSYERIVAELGALPVTPDVAKLFHVDLYKPATSIALGSRVVGLMQEAIRLLGRLTPHSADESLRRFRDAFVERFGAGAADGVESRRWIPLADALDDDIGVGFAFAWGAVAEPSPILDGLEFDAGDEPTLRVSMRDARLLRAVTESMQAGGAAWQLTDADVASLTAKTPATLPNALAVVGTLIGASPDARSADDLRLHVHAVHGPSGAELLGRFCHGDADLRRGVEAHLRAEEAQHPEAVFAEVVHLPNPRVGNVIGRPLLRRWDIPYLGDSGADRDHQIDVRDLSVAVIGERVVLRSSKLGREVIPRLTSAHNFTRESAGLFRFLCLLQRQYEASALEWSWGAMHLSPFLPRVVRGRLVLSIARWRLTRDDIAPLAAVAGRELFDAVQALRTRRGLPRWVCMADTGLPVDLDNAMAVESWAHLIKDWQGALVSERFPEPSDLVVHATEGRFMHEVVVPFVRAAPAEPVVPRAMFAHVTSTARRTFAPGSEWLYAKLYTGTGAADDVLAQVVQPVLASGRRHIDRWFFVRYGDPQWHVRVRFQGRPDRLLDTVLPLLHAAAAPLLADGRIWKIQLDTYEREIERYGGADAIERIEELFEADSEAALAIVDNLHADAADHRARVAFVGCHRLLMDLGLDLKSRVGVWSSLRAGLGVEHRVDAAMEKQLGRKLRAERDALMSLLRDGVTGDDPARAALIERSRRFGTVVPGIAAGIRGGTIESSLMQLGGHLVHMHCNRVLAGSHRAQELVLYDWLLRLESSELARHRDR